MSEVTLKETVPLYLTEPLVNKIQYLCKEVHDQEWSGVLMLDIEGGIEDLSSMKMTALDIFPMHKGSAAYTEYEFGEELLDLYDENPELIGKKISHIHSHNNMAVYFSGTDMSELHDNAPLHNYYVSLIVNNRTETCCKIAFISEVEEATTSVSIFRGSLNKLFEKKTNSKKQTKVLNIIDVDVVFPEQQIEDFFKDRVSFICEEYDKEQERKVANRQPAGFYQNSHIPGYNTSQYPRQESLFPQQGLDEMEEPRTASDDEIENFITYLLTYGKVDNKGNIGVVKRAGFTQDDGVRLKTFIYNNLDTAFSKSCKCSIPLLQFLMEVDEYLGDLFAVENFPEALNTLCECLTHTLEPDE